MVFLLLVLGLADGKSASRFTASETRLTRLPGHEKNSWGYHGDDGCSYNAEKVGTSYGETFGGWIHSLECLNQ